MFRHEFPLNGVVLRALRRTSLPWTVIWTWVRRSRTADVAEERAPNADSGPALRQEMHSYWVVASQDCTLDQSGIDETEPIIELRPVLRENPPTDWGIRSGRFLLDQDHYVDDYRPRISIAPVVLYHVAQLGHGPTTLEPARALAFKTWLGLRYDRPAVPPDRLDLAQAIGEAVRRKGVAPRWFEMS
jgi:hypothetical protein